MTAHLERFNAAVQKERDALDGKGPKMWFTDYIGADPLELVTNVFDPSGEDGEWASEHAVISTKDGSSRRRNEKERCVCYLAAGQRDMRLRYMEDEVRACARQKVASSAWVAMDASLSGYFGVDE